MDGTQAITKTQKWKIRLTTRYIENDRQGVFVETNTSILDRDNSCKLCQLDDEIIMNDIDIDAILNLSHVSISDDKKALFSEQILYRAKIGRRLFMI